MLTSVAVVAAVAVASPAINVTTLPLTPERAARNVALKGQSTDRPTFDAFVLSTRTVLVDFDAGLLRTKRVAFDRLTAGATERVAADRAAAEAAEANAAEVAAATVTAPATATSGSGDTTALAAKQTTTGKSATTTKSVDSAPSTESSPTSTSTSTPATTSAAASDAPTTVVPPATTAKPTTTQQPTTTVAPIASKIPISALGSLTGLRSGPNRPALAVKIDNSAAARPQSGINEADVVMEELVEFGLTRLIAIYHSNDPATVGPVRSARTSDIHLLSNLNQPLFSYSGANEGVLKQLKGADLRLAGAPNLASGYTRSSSRRAPHNLFVSPSKLRANVGGAGDAPAMFAYRPAGSAAINGARPKSGVSVKFGAETVAYTWNGVGWIRTISGRPHTDSTGKVVAPENVVVRFIDYRQSAIDARSPEAIAVGSGSVWVLTDGALIEGTWSQASVDGPTRYADADGEPILLTPGRTWVALAKPGTASTF